MAWDNPGIIGFNFRITSGYVTDGSDETYALPTFGATGAYPITRKGCTFGWQNITGGADVLGVDRDSGVDRRLAGVNYIGANSADFRVDLESAGTYDIRLANGDTGGTQGDQDIEILDNTTSLYSYTKASVTQDHYYDANGIDRTEAAWPTDNTARRFTFSTTTFILRIGSVSHGPVTVIAHLHLERVVSSRFFILTHPA